MKIKVEVDLSDFYQEDDDGDSFSEQIKSHIAWSVKHEILKDWKEKITTEFTKSVVEEIEKSKMFFINDTLKDLAENAKIKKRYSSDEMISIVDYIKEELSRLRFETEYVQKYINSKVSSQKEYLENMAKDIVKELKDRYDMLFASQIVSKLNENGMLKEKVAKILLDKNEII